ncbi:MAG TPA: 3-hydroxyacyl-CoA dehydrogenase family protein [Fredinandcohnia sp.]|nr:3-hydroxyacyl-CoA dehydrogenase family protein [Fredinandcohnia sp.]
MERRNVEKVAVLGAGTMGAGIAQVAAAAGYATALYDVGAERARAALERIRADLGKAVEKGKLESQARDRALAALTLADDLGAACAGADLVIEAVPEDLALKIEVLQKVAEIVGPDAVIASNTSALSLTEIAHALPHPARVVGMHFFNPVPRMKLLEIVRAYQTSDETIALAREVGARMGKEAIVVQDVPGFASSRLGIALGMEAIRMLESGVASAEEIDKAMKLGYGHPMGPLELTDLVGLDVRLAIAEHLHRELGGTQFQPPQLLKRMVKAGKLGRKTGEGFYKYPRD